MITGTAARKVLIAECKKKTFSFSKAPEMWVNFLCASFIFNYETLPKESLIIQTALLHKTKAGNEIFNHTNDSEGRRGKYKLHAIHATEECF
jgi:hypothetical protein